MELSTEEITKAIGAELRGNTSLDSSPHKVCTDTRTIEKNDLFFALKGERFDGHDFIKEAYEKGARHFVVSEEKKLSPEIKKNAVIFLVGDTLKAYGDLAKFYRKKFKIPAVAVTGSSGKTTVKELCYHLLSQKFKVLRNRGTENNLVGVPKTIFQLDASHEVMVIEMGTSNPGEIERLSEITAPQIGVLTQIGCAHLEGLGSQEGVLEEKIKIMNHLERGGVLILNGQDPFLKDITSGVHKILRVGIGKGEWDLAAEQIWCHEKGNTFHIDNEMFETQLISRANVTNGLLAMLVAETLGVERAVLKKSLPTFKAVTGRMTVKEISGIFFIDDSYNSNPQSFKAALETLKEFKIREKKGVVCGDMLELGEKSEEYHRQIGAFVAETLFDFVIASGPACKWLVEEALKNGFSKKKIYHVKDSVEAGKLCRELASVGDRILVKGSRGMKMEKIFEAFQ